jgi:hypothetical protein
MTLTEQRAKYQLTVDRAFTALEELNKAIADLVKMGLRITLSTGDYSLSHGYTRVTLDVSTPVNRSPQKKITPP